MQLSSRETIEIEDIRATLDRMFEEHYRSWRYLLRSDWARNRFTPVRKFLV